MGLYRFINEKETLEMKSVEDEDINNLLQSALKYHPELLLESRTFINKKFLRKETKITLYSLYIESRGWDGTSYQAEYVLSNVDEKSIRIYLYGIIDCGIYIKKI